MVDSRGPAAERYPLSWPTGWARTPYHRRQAARFAKKRMPAGAAYARSEPLGVGDGLDRLTGELRRLLATHVIISSNLQVRQDGLPYANQARKLDDPGVAVYFKLKGQPRVLACDRWRSAADNMAAIAGHIEALRAVDRYGVGSLEQAFAGYAALPADTAADWRMVLFGVKDWRGTREDVEAAFRAKAREVHPDAGGSHEAMVHLNRARDFALQELGG